MDQIKPELKLHTVTVSPSLILDKTKEHAAPYIKQFFIGICIIYVIMGCVPEYLGLIFPHTYVDVIAQFVHIDETLRTQLPSEPAVIYLYALLMNGVIKLGEALYVLTFIRNRQVEYSSIFEGFQYYFKALLLFLVQVFIIAIWSMCFVIPGVLAALNFSQSFFIFADNPDKKIFEILAESKLRMFGNRMAYFKLILVYIPYLLSGYLPLAIVGLFFNVDVSSFLGLTIVLIAQIAFFCMRGYMALGMGTFYELLLNGDFKDFRYSGQDIFRNAIIQ